MKKWFNKISVIMIAILNIAVVVLFTSCVGTVADKNAKSSVTVNTKKNSSEESFKGLQSAKAVAHDKIELVFDPASGNPVNLSYEVYVNNSSLPIKISGSSLEYSKTVDQSYIFTITGLKLKTKYNFNMRVVEVGSDSGNLSLDPNKSLTAETFSNETADFMGISSLVLGSGNSATTSVTVKWIPATIKGTSLNIRPTDPIAYEIIYWSAGFPKNTIQVPSSYTIPVLNRDSSYVVNNLIPGTTYYFQVRAIQKSYALNISTDPLFKREVNSRVMKIATLADIPLDLSFITNGNLYLVNPIEERGREELDVSWNPAWGNNGFFSYRVFYKKINLDYLEHLQDQFLDLDNLDAGVSFVNVDSLITNVVLKDLDPKAYYQVKVFACTVPMSVGEEELCSINTSFGYSQIHPPLAPFNGILTITNPTSVTALDQVTLNFEAPETNRGFLNKLNVYCHNPANIEQKVLIPTSGVTAATGIANCDNTSLVGVFPTTIEEFNTFSKLTIKLKQIANSVDSFCFSMAPVISYADLVGGASDDELESPVVKCITPNALPPTMAEFPGRDSNCNISGNSLTITWAQPTGGIYSNFILFYKKKVSPSDVFNFPTAVSDYYGATSNGYQSILLDGVTYSKKITNLIEGESYFVGVLTYIIDPFDAAKKIFSNYNSNTAECRLPTPSPIFNEWVDLMALGPKEDGLAVGLNGSADYLYEKLDADGAPIETTATSDEIVSNIFDGGVARTSTASGSAKYYKTSATGVIKLVWKDITFTNGSSMASFIIASGEEAQSNRSLRNYGYKVYRSEDNRQSWTDLTVSGPIYPNDLAAIPSTVTSYVKNNGAQTAVSERLVSFIDYSVEHLTKDTSKPKTDDVDRARVYWYKVIPYFLKKEQTYYNTTNNEHHIIRATLPPRNMALVHRMIANRTVCLELQKSINKKAGANYSCNYNGVGATGLSYPWQKGNTVYDLGGDLLVDRFELGCAFTRGAEDGSSFNASISTSVGLKNNADMDGFKGCFNISQSAYEPYQNMSVAANSSGTYRPHQVLAGDCFGKDLSEIAYIGTNPILCSGAKKDYFGRYSYPGSKAVEIPCSDIDSLDEFANFPHFPSSDYFTSLSEDVHPTQSEYAAVYYDRAGYLDDWSYSRPLIYKGALSIAETGKLTKLISYGYGGTETGVVRRSSCQMNLGYKDGAKYIPRWLPVTALINGLSATAVNTDNSRDAAVSLKLYDKTITEVKSNPHLYSDTMVAPPSRFSTTLPLTRLFSSNSSKLPPLDGLSQQDLSLVCGTYKVEVGIKKGATTFVTLSGAKSKRIIRKKESTISGAWASKFSEADINNYEKNQCNGSNRNQTGTANINNANLITPLFPNASRVGAPVITGSSNLDGAGHTEKCVSKFGIQDLVGNYWETNSEEVFCDYRPERSARLFIGDYKGGVEAAGIDKTKSVTFKGSTSLWYDSSADVNGAMIGNGVRAMVEENIDNRSGTCSIVDKRVEDSVYLNGNSIIPIIKSDGTLNTSIVLTQKSQDQESVNTLRNGDGSFLTFGKDKVTMALDKANKIANFTLFNPAIGLPILCGASAACDVNSDNQFVKTNVALGNSVFSNEGTAEIYTHVLAGGVPATDLREYYINQWLINQIINTTGLIPATNDPDIEYPITNIPPSNGASYTTPNEISHTGWAISRDLNTGETGATLRMYTGGGANTQSGRYSLKFEGKYEEQERFPSRLLGGRCVILINNE